MTAQPDMNPLLSKGGPASSFMVQSAVEPVGQDSEAVLEGCESQISDHDVAVCAHAPPVADPPQPDCPDCVMTSTTSLQPSAVQAVDSMRSLAVLTGLIALHGLLRQRNLAAPRSRRTRSTRRGPKDRT